MKPTLRIFAISFGVLGALWELLEVLETWSRLAPGGPHYYPHAPQSMAELRKDMKPTLRIFAISFGVLGALYVGVLLEVLRNLESSCPRWSTLTFPTIPRLPGLPILKGSGTRSKGYNRRAKSGCGACRRRSKVAARGDRKKTVQSWEFFKHEPTSFEVTFNYKLADDIHPNLNGPTVVLRLPTEVEIATTTLVISDPPAEIGSDTLNLSR